LLATNVFTLKDVGCFSQAGFNVNRYNGRLPLLYDVINVSTCDYRLVLHSSLEGFEVKWTLLPMSDVMAYVEVKDNGAMTKISYVRDHATTKS